MAAYSFIEEMENGFTVEVAWGRLHESMESVARRFARMLQDLAAIHPALADWKKLGGPRRKPPRPFCAMPPDIDELVRIFTEGRYFTDIGREPMPNLGYTAVAWNGHNDALGCFLEVEAGALHIGSPRSNSAKLQFLIRDPDNAEPLSAVTLVSIFRVMIAAWEPVWGTIGNMTLWKILRGAADERHRYTGGWMVYLGAAFDDHVATPPGGVVRRPPQGGRL